jgi:hypothetical protein
MKKGTHDILRRYTLVEKSVELNELKDAVKGKPTW